MPIVTNHKGPSFREYSRTPAEKKIVELESEVADMKNMLAQLIAERAPARDNASTNSDESTNNK